MRIFILNGPNLNMLGAREPEIYGHTTLADIEELCQKTAEKCGLSVDFMQSNVEGELVTAIQQAPDSYNGLIINPAAYTHTSVAILDALKTVNLPIIELHLSNTQAREDFRHHSYVSQVATGIICGFGADGYRLAIEAMAKL